jgi:acetoin utilization protein AcuB
MNKAKLTVREWMNSEPSTAGSQDNLQTVVELLCRRGVRSVPILDQGRLVGIVTDRDIRQVGSCNPLFNEDESRRYLSSLKVSAVMTADPLRISPDAPLTEAAKLLEMYGISSLPVVDGDALVGIISLTDFLRAFIEQNTASEEVAQ